MKKRLAVPWLFLLPSIVKPGGDSTGQPLPMNDTGITVCGDFAFDGGSGNSSNTLDCSLSTDEQGDPVPPGQDGHFGRDVEDNTDIDGRAGFSFTKIDALGNVLPPDANSWTCVLDNVTGLMWEVKTDDGGLRDSGWTYTWYDTGSNEGVQNGGECSDNINCDTGKFVEQVNSVGLCGYHDWRLPTREALRTIVDYSPFADPTIDTDWFPFTAKHKYWSTSGWAFNSDYAWYVDFGIDYGGGALSTYVWGSFRVRLVRHTEDEI